MTKTQSNRGFIQHLLYENIKRLKIIGIVGFCINTIIISTSTLRDGIGYLGTLDCLYRMLWMIATLIYIVGVGPSKDENALGLRQKVFFYGAATLSLIFSALLTATTATAQGFTYLYIINVLLTASFLILPYFAIVVVMIPSMTILVYAALTTPEGILTQYGTMINIIAVSSFAIVIAHTNYCLWSSRYVDRQTIETQNKELHLLSSLDGLTGIPNRRHIDFHMDQSWKMAQDRVSPFSLLMVDIDHFKRYNDFYGHIKGDHCLISVATCIQKTLYKDAYHVGRYGGEEFLVLLPNTTFDEAKEVANRVKTAIYNLKEVHEMSSFEYVTVSIGVAYSENLNHVSKNELIDQADRALYQAKLNGRNQIAFQNEVFESV